MEKNNQLLTFKFTGTTLRGRKIKGEVTEKSLMVAKDVLKRQNINVKSITKKPNFSFGGGKVKSIDTTLFARQMATMMRSGLNLISSFEIVAGGTTNPKMKALILDLKADIESGNTFAQALEKYPIEFNNLFVSLVAAGETSGSLDEMLDRIATYKEKSEALKSKIKKAMKYPISVIVISIIVTIILMLKVVPVFKDLFESFGGELPAFTQLVVTMSEFTKAYWHIGIATVFALIVAIKNIYARTPAFRDAMDAISLKLPIIGPILHQAIIARFSQTLATTFSSGVPLIECLEAAAKATGNSVYHKVVMEIREDVLTGQQLYFAMKTTCMFPNIAIQMTSIGEEAGALDSMLTKVAVYYEQQVDDAVDGLTSMMEPLIMAILGVLVGGLVIAMYLPIFQMGSVI